MVKLITGTENDLLLTFDCMKIFRQKHSDFNWEFNIVNSSSLLLIREKG